MALRQEPDHGAQEHGLTAARRADHAKDFAFPHIEREMIEHDLVAEAHDEIAHVDHGLLLHDHMPIEAKKMANRPSSTITRKIDFTTEAVVLRPSDSALPFTCSPSAQATMPITSPMKGAFS